MTLAPVFKREPFALAYLHQSLKPAIAKLNAALAAKYFTLDGVSADCRFEPFEGFRHPARQQYLFAETESTKARPWESAHQYGLAVDYAVRVYDTDNIVASRWTWDPRAPWRLVEEEAKAVGLARPIEWDLGHIEHPLFARIRALKY